MQLSLSSISQTVHLPTETLSPLNTNSPFFFPHPPASTRVLSDSMSLSILGVSNKWNQTVFVCTWYIFPCGSVVKNLPAVRETWVRSLGWEDPLEKGKVTSSSILAWRIPWTMQSMGSQSWTRLTFTFNVYWNVFLGKYMSYEQIVTSLFFSAMGTVGSQ